MRPYFSLLRVRFLNGLQYRASAIGGLATQLWWGVMLIFIYRGFYGDGAASGGFAFSDLVTYIWLQQAFLAFIWLYDFDGELLDMIISGGISYELCRPINIYQVWYVKLLSKRLASGFLRFLPIIIVGFIVPYPYNLAMPQSLLSFLLFVITLFLGLLLLVAISMLIFISIFKTMSPVGSIGIISTIGQFFAGTAIPIPLMPQWLQNVASFTPFRWTADLSLRVYSGHIATQEALWGIVMQFAWIVVLVSLGAFIMRRVSRLSMVQGG